MENRYCCACGHKRLTTNELMQKLHFNQEEQDMSLEEAVKIGKQTLMNENFDLEDEVEVEAEAEVEAKEEEDNSRWSYYVVKDIEHESASKNDIKKWLQERGTAGYKIIRGRQLSTSEKVKRIVSIN